MTNLPKWTNVYPLLTLKFNPDGYTSRLDKIRIVLILYGLLFRKIPEILVKNSDSKMQLKSNTHTYMKKL